MTDTPATEFTKDPDWESAVPFLKIFLAEWIKDRQHKEQALVIVGCPHGGNRETLTHLAKDLEWHLIEPPSAEEILAGERQWPADQLNKHADDGWVLPALDNCFLRHSNGLKLVRRFFADMFEGRISRAIPVTLYEMPYRRGDWISIEGTYGEVKSIGLRAVEIVTPDDTMVVIPHSKIWDKLIFNANDGTRYLQCVADFYLSPAHDGKKILDALYDVGMTSPFLQLSKPVVVVVKEQPWGTHYRIRAYPVDFRDQFRFTTDLTVRGKSTLIEMGAAFAQPPASVTTDS